MKILRRLEVDLMDELRRVVEHGMETRLRRTPPEKDKDGLVRQAEKMLKITFLEAKLFKSPTSIPSTCCPASLKDEDNLATRSLSRFNVGYDAVKQEVETSWPATAVPRPRCPAAAPTMTTRAAPPMGGGGARKQGDSRARRPCWTTSAAT